MDNHIAIPEFVSINQLCTLIKVSRSRYYQLVTAGYLAPPVYSIDSKRAYFTRELTERNLSVIRNNVGLNGKICLFYNTSRRAGSSPVKPAKNREQKPKPAHETESPYKDLIEGLSQLGIQDIKPSQLEPVIMKLYPLGIQNEDIGEVLKGIYRLLYKQNSTDNPDR